MNEGETQGEAPEMPSGAYSNFIGNSETATEEAQATEQESGGAEVEAPAETKAAETTETSKAESTSGNWEERYTNLQRKFGEQGNELGNLRKEIEQLKKGAEAKVDPFADDPTLKALNPEQKQMVLRGTDVAIKRLLADMGMSPTDLPQIKQMVNELYQTTTQNDLMREVSEIKKEFGEATFQKYLPKLEQVARTHPTLSPKEAWDLATAKDLRDGQTQKAKQLEAERKQRAASADFGKERPAKPMDGKLTQEALKKLSAVPQGRPSPRLVAIMREVKREMGG